MKGLFSISLLLIFLSTVCGQDKKPYNSGNIIFGGSFSMDQHKIEKINIDGFKVSGNERIFKGGLHLGIFALNNFAAGMKLENTRIFYEGETGNLGSLNYFLFEPFIRYYFPFGLFSEAVYGFGFDRTGENISDPYDDRKINTRCIGLGYCLFINRSIAIEPLLSYKVQNEYRTDDNTNKNISGLNFQIGIQLFINPFKEQP